MPLEMPLRRHFLYPWDMKKLLLLLLASGCAAVHNPPPVAVTLPVVPPTEVFIAGTVRNALPTDSVRVSFEEPGRRGIFKAAVGPGGDFRLRVTGLTSPIDAQISCGWFETVYLTPGDSMNLTLDRKEFLETLRFSGRGAAVNNYLTQAQRHFGYHSDQMPEALPAAASATPEEFIKLADAYRQRQFDTLAVYQARQPLPEAVIRSRRQVFDMQRAVSLLNFAGKRKHDTKAEPVLPTGYYDFLAGLPLREQPVNDIGAAKIEIAYILINSYRYARLLPADGRLPTTPGTAERLYAQATADFGDTPTRDYIVGGLLANQLYDFPGTGRVAVLAALPTFLAHNRDTTVAGYVRRGLARTAKLQSGQPAPAVSLRNAAGKSVSLQDFRGKVVYLDFWYSHCAPCLAEAPAATVLKKKFLGRDVVFLYISVDADAALWQQTIKKHALAGANSVHLLDLKGQQVHAAYAIGGYPSYWIIDREGRIWRGAAPRPSAGAETVAALEAALAAN